MPLEDLLVAQRLSRALSKYTSPSPAARAALQLQAVGKDVQPGQRVRFLFVRGKPDVHAWDATAVVDPRLVDVRVYRKLLLRAAENIFQPFGIAARELHLWMKESAAAVQFSVFSRQSSVRKPLFVINQAMNSSQRPVVSHHSSDFSRQLSVLDS